MDANNIILWIKELVDGKGIVFSIYILICCSIVYFISVKTNVSNRITIPIALILGSISWEYVAIFRYLRFNNKKNYVLLCINAENAEQYRKITLLLKEPLEKNNLPEDKSIKYIIPNSLRAGKKLQKYNAFAKKILGYNFIINIDVVTTRSNDNDVLKFVTKINCDLDNNKGRTQDIADKLYNEIFADFSSVDLKDEANQICVYGENLTILSNIVYGIIYVLLNNKNMLNLENGKTLLESAYKEIKGENSKVAGTIRNLILYATSLQYDIFEESGDLFDRNKVDKLNEYLSTYRKYHYCHTEYYIMYAIYEYIKNRNLKKCKDLLKNADHCADKDNEKNLSKMIVRFNKAFIFMNDKNYIGAFYQYKVAFDTYMKIPVDKYPRKFCLITDMEYFINQIEEEKSTIELKFCLAIVYAMKGDIELMEREIDEIEKLPRYRKMYQNVKNRFGEIIEYIKKQTK